MLNFENVEPDRIAVAVVPFDGETPIKLIEVPSNEIGDGEWSDYRHFTFDKRDIRTE